MVVLLTIASLSCSRIGLIYRSIGQNDTLTNFCGIHVRKYKLQVFALGCFLTGIGGGIMASYLTALSPDTFTFFTSLGHHHVQPHRRHGSHRGADRRGDRAHWGERAPVLRSGTTR